MNVSSVKNLNGEVFSAVQDASLTNVVQTNSGIWQDITAYQNASATYLTAVDLTPYATTAEVDSISSMLSGAIDYVSANAGDEFPVSADEAIQYVQTNSAGIDDTVNSVRTNSGAWGGDALPITGRDGIDLEIDNGTLYIGASAIDETVGCVQTNSGVWGGSALPISAGPGIKVNLVDNTLVFSNDETVLYSGERTSACVLSENPTNFYRIRVEDLYHNLYEFAPSIGDAHQEIKLTNFTGQPQQLYVQFSATNDKLYITKGFQTVYSTWDAPGNTTWTASNVNNTYSREIITGITGINRKQ